MNDTQNLTDIAPELAQKAIDLRAEYGYNCAQAVACALADAVAADSASLYAYTEGLGAGMGGHTENLRGNLGRNRSVERHPDRRHRKARNHQGQNLPAGKKGRRTIPRAQRTTLCGELKGIGTKAVCSAPARAASKTL